MSKAWKAKQSDVQTQPDFFRHVKTTPEETIVRYGKLVDWLASYYSQRFRDVPLEDLKQMGFIGLVEGAKDYCLDKAGKQLCSISYFLQQRIRFAILQGVTDYGYSIERVKSEDMATEAEDSAGLEACEINRHKYSAEDLKTVTTRTTRKLRKKESR